MDSKIVTTILIVGFFFGFVAPQTELDKQDIGIDKENGTNPLNYVHSQQTIVNAENETSADITTKNQSEPQSKLVNCSARADVMPWDPIQLVNASELTKLLTGQPNVTSRHVAAECSLILFYYMHCPFSTSAVPHFRALARAFRDVKMVVVDAWEHHSFNNIFSVTGVPTLVLVHNGRPVALFNGSEHRVEYYEQFLKTLTTLKPTSLVYVKSNDFYGSIPHGEYSDVNLVLSWMFIVASFAYMFVRSKYYTWLVEMLQNTWRMAEAQHVHAE